VTSPVLWSPNIELQTQAPSPQTKLNSVVLYGAAALLMFCPLAFGAVEPWSIFVLEAGSVLLLALWVVGQARSTQIRIIWNPLFLPMLLFAVLIGFQFTAGRTAYRHATLSSALLYVAFGFLCFVIVQCLYRFRQIKNLAVAFSVYGFSVAAFAILQDLTSNGKLYWLKAPLYGGWIYGPYVNHNHYAGLMELLTPIPLVIALSRSVPKRQRILAATAAAVMGSTIFLSGSRGGMIALTAQIVFLGSVLFKGRTRPTTLALVGFLATACGILGWLGGNQLLDRLASIHRDVRTELSGGMRLQIDRDTLRMFAASPVLGSGLGTYPDVYPQFRSFYTILLVDRAHNDYLQLLAETGMLGFAIMLWFLTLLYGRAAKNTRGWSNQTNRAAALAALVGVTGILVHGMVDFNLQIPANAAIFYVLCIVATMDGRFHHHYRWRVRDFASHSLSTRTELQKLL
jgi:O-antigen ligase